MSIFRQIVDRLSTASDEHELSELVNYVIQREISDYDIAYLASKLAGSGETFKTPDRNNIDIASTGGPSSLSTLLTPLYLRFLNWNVLKLGIPGRPAGGVDVLATIPGYRIHLDPAEVASCLKQCGYAHFVADERYAPLDAKLFIVRQRLGAQASVPLVIASLLAKKLAVGLKQVGFDIRVGQDNNFGNSTDEARSNAQHFCSVAQLLGLEAVCVLTDGSRPYQPFIGRGEALLALNQLFENKSSGWLQRHALQCWKMAIEVTRCSRTPPQPDGVRLKTIFLENLVAQGSSLSAFHQRLAEILNTPRFTMFAHAAGWVEIRLGLLRSTLVEAQLEHPIQPGGFSDPAGVELLSRYGDFVKKNQPIAIVRGPEHLHRKLEDQLLKGIGVMDHQISSSPTNATFEEIISSG